MSATWPPISCFGGYISSKSPNPKKEITHFRWHPFVIVSHVPVINLSLSVALICFGSSKDNTSFSCQIICYSGLVYTIKVKETLVTKERSTQLKYEPSSEKIFIKNIALLYIFWRWEFVSWPHVFAIKYLMSLQLKRPKTTKAWIFEKTNRGEYKYICIYVYKFINVYFNIHTVYVQLGCKLIWLQYIYKHVYSNIYKHVYLNSNLSLNFFFQIFRWAAPRFVG